MGFEEHEALDNIEPAQKSFPEDDSLFAHRPKPTPTFKHTVSATPEAVDRLKNQEAVTLRETDDGKVEIAVTGRVDGELEKAIAATIPEPERQRSEEHTSELQSLMRISYAVFCLKKKKHKRITNNTNN